MEALLEYRNVIGYALIVAMAALIVLRLVAARNRREGSGQKRRTRAEMLAELRNPPEIDGDAETLEIPGKRMNLGGARVQFYVMILAAIAVVLVWLIHRMA